MRTGTICHHNLPLQCMPATGSLPGHPSNAPSLLPDRRRNYLSKPAGAVSLSSSVWNLHLGGSRTSGVSSRCRAVGTGDVASSPLRSLPWSKERKKLFPVQKPGETHWFLLTLIPRGRQRSGTNQVEKDSKHLQAANSSDHPLPQLSLHITLSPYAQQKHGVSGLKQMFSAIPPPLFFPFHPSPQQTSSAHWPCSHVTQPQPLFPLPQGLYLTLRQHRGCVCVRAPTTHARSDICSEPHSPDAQDCLEIASMGSRCSCLQWGSGGGRQKRSRERVKVRGGKPPRSSLPVCTISMICSSAGCG